ncbi:hypothetical protein [Clostridium botulinum]|uniref:hypothetical protein n=1 Tax=Clostridium botulinum TaxID=1491 RepID=UPI0004CFFBCA|nr:hypothetical protein [Clostridium botulinum]MBY6773669.1 hypothetical protein [Clostridium botulinum]MBY6864289.1 hypothetical protein [Clostridium botulinum]MBY6984833.1 hypothetical protein [Clostridium botulinum]NFP26145.1 hypothetical protein [Clostridium botulinum]
MRNEKQNNYSIRYDIKEYEELNKSDFIKSIKILPLHIRKVGYANILYEFLLLMRNSFNISEELVYELADCLHNLPHALNDFENFDDSCFWNVYVDSNEKEIFLRKWFLSGIAIPELATNMICVGSYFPTLLENNK